MKNVKPKYRKTDNSGKKSVLKFRDYEDIDEDHDFPRGHAKKKRKDVGKRLHRIKTMKDDFGFSDSNH